MKDERKGLLINICKFEEYNITVMEKDMRLIGASDLQTKIIQRFVSQYNWELFEHGCYFEFNSITLLLQVLPPAKGDMLEAQLRQTREFTVGDRIASACNISLFETSSRTFEKNLIMTYKELQREIIKASEANKYVIESLQNFFVQIQKNLGIPIALGAERNIPR